MRRLTTVIAVTLILVAGCGGQTGVQQDGGPNSTETVEIEGTSQPEYTATSDSTANSNKQFQSKLESVPLRISDLPEEYQALGETNATARESSQLEDRGVTRLYERAFSHAPEYSDSPERVLSSAILYETSKRAATDSKAILSSLERNGSEIESVSLAEGVSAQKVTFENEKEMKNVMFYGRIDSLVIYVVVSDSNRFHNGFAESMFVRMYADATR